MTYFGNRVTFLVVTALESLLDLADMPTESLAWHQWAACRQYPELQWVPEPWQDTRAQLRICREDCAVQEECLAYALARPSSWGVWGGTTLSQRVLIRRQRAQAAHKERPGGASWSEGWGVDRTPGEMVAS